MAISVMAVILLSCFLVFASCIFLVYRVVHTPHTTRNSEKLASTLETEGTLIQITDLTEITSTEIEESATKRLPDIERSFTVESGNYEWGMSAYSSRRLIEGTSQNDLTGKSEVQNTHDMSSFVNIQMQESETGGYCETTQSPITSPMANQEMLLIDMSEQSSYASRPSEATGRLSVGWTPKPLDGRHHRKHSTASSNKSTSWSGVWTWDNSERHSAVYDTSTDIKWGNAVE